MTATELTESTERRVCGRKSTSVLSVLSVAESYKKQIRFSIQYMLVNIIKPQMDADFQVAYPRSYIHYSCNLNHRF